MAILSILLTVIIVAVSILIVLIVLIQRPKQEGLGAAFGGGTLDSALGAHTTDVLQKATTLLGIIFFVSAISLAMVKTRQFRASAASDVMEQLEKKEATLPNLPPGMSAIPGLEGLDLTSPPPGTALGDSPTINDAPVVPAEPTAPAAPKAEGDILIPDAAPAPGQ